MSRILLSFSSLLLCFWSITGQAQTFKIATVAPDGTHFMKEMRAGAKEITERSDGRIQFKFYPGGVMGNDQAVFRKMRIRQLQGAALTGGALTSVYPDAQLYSIPFVFHSQAEAEHVRKTMDDDIRAGMRRGGMEILGMSSAGFARVFSNKPIAKIEDLAGQKVWLPEGDLMSEKALNNAGVSPIPLPIADVYTALQTGLIDTVGSSPSAIIALQWHTKIKYMTDVPLGYLMGYLVVDGKTFKRLSSADQALVTEVMGQRFAAIDKQQQVDNESALQALQALGVDFVSADQAELKRWHALAEKTIEELRGSDQFTEAGLQKMQGILTQYRSQP